MLNINVKYERSGEIRVGTAPKPCPLKRFSLSLFIVYEEITFSSIRHARNFYRDAGFHRGWTFNLQVHGVSFSPFVYRFAMRTDFEAENPRNDTTMLIYSEKISKSR